MKLLLSLVLCLLFGVNSHASTSVSDTPSLNKAIRTTERYSFESRCKATTKKGTQCKRNGGTSGYCWQHEPVSAPKKKASATVKSTNDSTSKKMKNVNK